jgi:hypothetical protein
VSRGVSENNMQRYGHPFGAENYGEKFLFQDEIIAHAEARDAWLNKRTYPELSDDLVPGYREEIRNARAVKAATLEKPWLSETLYAARVRKLDEIRRDFDALENPGWAEYRKALDAIGLV